MRTRAYRTYDKRQFHFACARSVHKMFQLSVCFFNIVLWTFRPIHTEWHDIKPISISDDTIHVHMSDDAGDLITNGHLPSAPHTIFHDRVGVAIAVLPKPFIVDQVDTSTKVPPIRYEDLEHIVGPGFEEELERFYEQHKFELDESTRRGYIDESIVNTVSNVSSKPSTVYHFVPGDDDPWSQYDKPAQNGVHHPDPSQTELTTADSPPDPDQTTFAAHEIASNVSASTVRPSAKRVLKLVPMRVVGISADALQQSRFGFPGFVAFLRSIQDSFVSSTSRSIQDKMRMLKTFRDKMLRQISTECFYILEN